VGNVARVNVTLPVGLYKRLQRRRDLNWSRIASRAFEMAIDPRPPDALREIRELVSRVEELEEENRRLRSRLGKIRSICEEV
jgi:cell shape-determining protein MreC